MLATSDEDRSTTGQWECNKIKCRKISLHFFRTTFYLLLIQRVGWYKVHLTFTQLPKRTLFVKFLFRNVLDCKFQ